MQKLKKKENGGSLEFSTCDMYEAVCEQQCSTVKARHFDALNNVQCTYNPMFSFVEPRACKNLVFMSVCLCMHVYPPRKQATFEIQKVSHIIINEVMY